MTYPSNIYVPNGLFGTFPTVAGRNYKITINFPSNPNADPPVPWGVGVLLNGPANQYVPSQENRSKPHIIEFTGSGDDLRFCFIMSTTGAMDSNQNNLLYANIGYGANEVTPDMKHMAGRLKVSMTNSKVNTKPLNTDNNFRLEGLAVPHYLRLRDYFNGNNFSIEKDKKYQKSLESLVYDIDGRVYSQFSQYLPNQNAILERTKDFFIFSFLSLDSASTPGRVKWTVGDPQDEATMEIDEDE